MDAANTTLVHNGTNSIAVTLDGWGALYLHTDTPLDLKGYDMLTFWIYGGGSGTHLTITANSSGTSYPATAPAGVWTQVYIPLSAFGNPAPTTLYDLYWQDATGSSQPVFYLDDISLHPTPPPPVSDYAIYSESLASGWENWSWDAATILDNPSPVHSGTKSIATLITKDWGALYLSWS